MNTEILGKVIEAAESIGLSQSDINLAKELLENFEHGLSFDLIVGQIFENDIIIDVEFFNLVAMVAGKLGYSEDRYSFLKGLIR